MKDTPKGITNTSYRPGYYLDKNRRRRIPILSRNCIMFTAFVIMSNIVRVRVRVIQLT